MKRLLRTSLLLHAALAAALTAASSSAADKLCDHEVVLDKDGRLLPWTSFDRIIAGSMNFIEHCPTTPTKFGDDPWYLVTSEMTATGEFRRNQNCQGSHAYWAVETATRYYAYSGDAEVISIARRILDRVLKFNTPADWAWANVPRTQDNSPDGEYTDDTSEPDKMCLVGIACVRFYKLTGEKKYLDAAHGIADTIVEHASEGRSQDDDAKKSPLPFRVELKTGKVLDDYTSHMLSAVILFDELVRLGEHREVAYRENRDRLWQWMLKYPLLNHEWTGYYEDVPTMHANKNQQSPLETARFMLRHPEMDPDYRRHVPELLAWVKDRFGKTKRHGATSIREQDCCFKEMSSHTARFASVAAAWYGVSGKSEDREEARAAFALASYSAFNKHSRDGRAINYVGLGYVVPWFTDSYFDYVPHLLDGMAELPEMAPADADHLLGSSDVVKHVAYGQRRIEYKTFGPSGREILRIRFTPDKVLADGKPLPPEKWTFGEFRGASGVLRIERDSARNLVIE